jgi:hypothetical protein
VARASDSRGRRLEALATRLIRRAGQDRDYPVLLPEHLRRRRAHEVLVAEVRRRGDDP